jgi:Autographiviridae endonuclease VII
VSKEKRARQREQRRKRMENPEYKRQYLEKKRRDRWLRRYGMKAEDYDKLFESQGGRCGICQQPGEILCVDHDHKTGEVRGLLCNRCNMRLDWAETYMESIQEYL